METFPVTLSSRGLANVQESQAPKSFEFRVNQISYRCSPFIADFLSPKISRLHEVDSTMNLYIVMTEDPKEKFGDFLEMGNGRTLPISDDDISFFSSLTVELDNCELYEVIDAVIADCLTKELTIESVLPRLQFQKLQGADISDEVDFIAAHFWEFSESDLDSLDVGDVEEVFMRNSLRVQSEDFLSEFLIRRVSEDRKFFSLFEYVHFEHLSSVMIDKFIEISGNFLTDMNVRIWQRVCERLRVSATARAAVCEYKFNRSDPLNGIISHLTEIHGGNLHDKGIIEVIGQSVDQAHHAKNVCDISSPSTFESRDYVRPSICYDLKGLRVDLTHYAIQICGHRRA
jgi:hypothetical protein